MRCASGWRGPLGQRSRKRRGVTGSEPPRAGGEAGAESRRSDPARQTDRYARGRERDAAVRSALQPLAPGERPRSLTISALLAALLGAANVVLLAAGWEIQGGGQSVVGVLLFAGLMGAAAIGMWQGRYWAVLGFEALLGIAIIYAALALLVASNLEAVIRCVAIIAVAAPLFWSLIRVMARLQLPSRRPQEPVG